MFKSSDAFTDFECLETFQCFGDRYVNYIFLWCGFLKQHNLRVDRCAAKNWKQEMNDFANRRILSDEASRVLLKKICEPWVRNNHPKQPTGKEQMLNAALKEEQITVELVAL